MKPVQLFAVPVVMLLGLAGCNQKPPIPDQGSESAPVSTTSSSVEINDALPSTDLALTMALVGQPKYSAESGMVSTEIAVTNNGPNALATAGKLPVQLGLVIRDINGGMDIPPAKQDFLRIPLPKPIQAGERIVIPVAFPAAPTIGGIVIVDGVQEGVSWFSSYGEPILEVGRFVHCTADPTTLCFADGTKVSTGG